MGAGELPAAAAAAGAAAAADAAAAACTGEGAKGPGLQRASAILAKGDATGARCGKARPNEAGTGAALAGGERATA